MTTWWCYLILITIFLDTVYNEAVTSEANQQSLSLWGGPWRIFPTTDTFWSLGNRIPMTAEYDTLGRGKNDKFKVKKKFKKFLLPLLLAYKLKFFALIPILVGGLLLLTASTGLAGFFFALFAAAMGLKSGGWHH